MQNKPPQVWIIFWDVCIDPKLLLHQQPALGELKARVVMRRGNEYTKKEKETKLQSLRVQQCCWVEPGDVILNDYVSLPLVASSV